MIALRTLLAVVATGAQSGASHVGECDGSPIRIGRYTLGKGTLSSKNSPFDPAKPDVLCRRINGTCACGRAEQLAAAAERTSARGEAPGTNASRVCVIARTFVGHVDTFQGTLQTLLASARAAGRSVALETHLLNTDRRPLDERFRQRLANETALQAPDYQLHLHHYIDPTQHFQGREFGYVHTDLMLRALRARGGCDFTLVTNGDNVFHINYLKRLLDDLHEHPDAVASAGEFFCHVQGRVVPITWRTGGLDLSAALFRSSYLDARKETFLLGQTKRRRGARLADGELAERVRNDVGLARARKVDELLLFHL